MSSNQQDFKRSRAENAEMFKRNSYWVWKLVDFIKEGDDLSRIVNNLSQVSKAVPEGGTTEMHICVHRDGKTVLIFFHTRMPLDYKDLQAALQSAFDVSSAFLFPMRCGWDRASEQAFFTWTVNGYDPLNPLVAPSPKGQFSSSSSSVAAVKNDVSPVKMSLK